MAKPVDLPCPHANALAFRTKYAQILRQFVSGRMTTDEYENHFFEFERQFNYDPAAWAVFAAVWHLYDDIWPHRMAGAHRLDRTTRRRIAQFILFLRSGAQYTDLVPERQVPKQQVSSYRGIPMVLAALALGAISLLLIGTYFTLVLAACGFLLLLLFLSLFGRAVALDPAVFEVSWTPTPDHLWPFGSQDALLQALSTPTFLFGGHGR